MRKIPEKERYFWLSFILAVLGNQIPFQLARLLARGKVHYDLSLPFDAAVPFLPWTVCIYAFAGLLFWFFLYRRIAALPRQTADRFFCANLLGKGIAFLFFVFLPTEMTRPELNETGFWNLCMRLVYSFDEPNNLFPSLHCFLAWLCWAGIRRNKQVPAIWRVSALVMAAAVCISTLTTREHVMVDVAAGILLSELCWLLAGRDQFRRLYSSLADRILLGNKGKQEPCP
jgi:membrane-associated phospholipid phosphatase